MIMRKNANSALGDIVPTSSALKNENEKNNENVNKQRRPSSRSSDIPLTVHFPLLTRRASVQSHPHSLHTKMS
jgi:hypothetical protein